MIPERGVHESESCHSCRHFNIDNLVCNKYRHWVSIFDAKKDRLNTSKKVTCDSFLWRPPSKADNNQSILGGIK